jgi:hypothetical protein
MSKMRSLPLMRLQLQIVLLAFWASLCPLCVGQGAPTVKLRLFDSETGFAVPSESVRCNLPIIGRDQETAGLISISSPTKETTLEVTATGYRPFQALLKPHAGKAVIEIQLHPVKAPMEFQKEAIQRFLVAGKTLIIGFVSDDKTGKPLSGVVVSSDHPESSSQTGSAGFFALSIPGADGTTAGSPMTVNLRFTKEGYQTLVRQSVQLFANTTKKYRLRLSRGTGVQNVSEEQFHPGAAKSSQEEVVPMEQHRGAAKSASIALPTNVRVGTNCTSGPKSCSTVTVMLLDDYSKHVLPSEWIASWNSESLKAGSVAIRTYASWFTLHPLTDTYDICNTTACQVFDPDATNQATDDAVDATTNTVLTDSSNAIVKSEYAAENNDAGCGDGKSGDNSATGPCIDDPVCKGKTNDGHGRGMCQNGSQRWATGKNADGTDASGGSQKWDWILTHYYPNYKISQGSSFATPALE